MLEGRTLKAEQCALMTDPSFVDPFAPMGLLDLAGNGCQKSSQCIDLVPSDVIRARTARRRLPKAP